MKKINLLFVLLFLFSQINFAQREDAKSLLYSQIQLAEQAYRNKEYVASLKEYEIALKEKANQTGHHYYNAACSAALAGQKTKAWKYLDLALANGFNDYPHVFKDVDLVTLHNDAKWKKMQREKGLDIEKIKKAFAPYSKTKGEITQLVPFKKGRLWGYMQRGTKKILIQPMFQEADFFQSHQDYDGSIGQFRENQYYMEIIHNGYKLRVKPNAEIITEIPREDYPVMAIDAASPMYDNGSYTEVFVPKADKQGLGFTEQLGTIVSYSSDYESMMPYELNGTTYAIVKYKGKVGIVDSEGKPMFPIFDFKYKYLGVSTLYDKNRTTIVFAQSAETEKYALLTREGKIIVEGLDERINDYDGQFFHIKKGGKWGVIHIDGSEMIAPKYSDKNYYRWATAPDEKSYYYFQFKLDGDFFYVDENGVEYR